MRFRLSSILGSLALVLITLVALGTTTAQADPPGGKIQFSAPSSPTVASNLNRLDPRQTNFKQVQNDLFKPFNFNLPENPTEELPPPPQMAPSMPDKRAQDLIEKRKNWAFADWNDLFPDPSMDDISNSGPDGKDKKSVSLIERYCENLNQKQSSATNRSNGADRYIHALSSTNTFDPKGETFTPEGQINKIMKRVFNLTPDGADKSVVDFQHSAFPQATAEQLQDQKRRYEEFQQLLDPHRAIAPIDPLNPGAQAQGAGYNTVNQFLSAPAHRSPVNPSMGVADPTARAFYSHAYDDPTALALGQTNNLLTPKPTTPQTPAFQLEPFDNLPKRKF
jgi:hypothetical protein